MLSLCVYLWVSRSEWLIVSGDKMEIFIRLLRWCVWSVLLYGNDAWMINAYTKKYLKAIETWFYNKINGISLFCYLVFRVRSIMRIVYPMCLPHCAEVSFLCPWICPHLMSGRTAYHAWVELPQQNTTKSSGLRWIYLLYTLEKWRIEGIRAWGNKRSNCSYVIC